jgi:hypothetical protein
MTSSAELGIRIRASHPYSLIFKMATGPLFAASESSEIGFDSRNFSNPANPLICCRILFLSRARA